MPTVREIEQALFELAPGEAAMEWDNVGHLLGDPNQAVERVLVALDVTEGVADEAIVSGCQLVVAHHPVMNCRWTPVQNIRDDTFQRHLFLKLLRNNVSAICMHTNLDIAWGGVNDALAQRLELVDPGPLCENGLGRVGEYPESVALADYVRFVCQALGCNGLRYADAGKPVRRVAVGGGACGEFEDDAIRAGCDTFVTADVKHSQYLEARAMGINLMDAGHYATENVVCGPLARQLAQRFPQLRVLESQVHHEP